MSALILMAVALIAFFVAYKTYGSFLAKKFGLDDSNPTPAHTMSDGVDYVPAKAPVLLGHHFASIAGAAPIIGPIAAAVFGWIPAFLWIVLGGIFFGAVHDFSAIVASIRHKGKSIGVIIENTMGVSGKTLFNLFAWLTLILVLAAFANIIAGTFVATPEAGTASLIFIAIAVVYGYLVYRNNFPVVISTIIGVGFLVLAIWLGIQFPLEMSANAWIFLLFGYVIIASVIPVWVLLQPRDYLNSFLLYALLGGAVIGIFFYNPKIEFTGYAGFVNPGGQWLFPVLFVTIACGAISGFHSLVSSGTTSKQLNKESDAKLIGYGGMLIESTLAVVALITAIMLTQGQYGDLAAAGGPVNVFSEGVANFLATLGLPFATGKTFTALVVSAFALTTLDTATRLGRYVFQELFEMKGKDGSVSKNIGTNPYVATLATVIPAGALAMVDWKAIWPVFGSANQLLASLALLAVSVWLAKVGKKNGFTLYPMIFMLAVTLSALGNLIYSNLTQETIKFIALSTDKNTGSIVLVIISAALFILALVLAVFAYNTLRKVKSEANISA